MARGGTAMAGGAEVELAAIGGTATGTVPDDGVAGFGGITTTVGGR
jgi:hypothetical protein